jgi:hypothetical protein
MNEAWDNELLNDIGRVMTEAGLRSEVGDIGGKTVLVIEFEGENSAEDANIAVEHFSEDVTGISVMFTAASGCGEKETADITALLPYLNRFLSIGSFGITVPDGYFYFGTSFVIDTGADRASIIRKTAATFDICAETVNAAVTALAPVISGEKQVSELMNDDTAIIQF